jgi:uncharacterized lipoprotein YddW (UPF0748 family)
MLMLLLSVAMQCSVVFAAPVTNSTPELRGIWVTRWTYKSEAEVRQIMADVAGAGFNTVFFQVRGQHDAFYASTIEPWAAELTGTLGKNPGWDPLKTAVEAGHQHGLKVHAYLNAFTLWRGERPPPPSDPMHAWTANGDWLVADEDGTPMVLSEGYVYASPGNPAVRRRLARVAADIARRYAVDGIHLDHIRYPGPGFGHDMASLADWESEGKPDFDDWRRAAVVRAVAAVREAVDLPVSTAVWGVYTNTWNWPEVSEGVQAYFQDAAAFTREGVVDALVPMIYWRPNPEGRLDFGALVRDHVSRANGRHVYAGIRADPAWGAEALVDMVKAARLGGANGVVFFEYSEAKPSFGVLKATVFEVPADPPAMSWR